MRRSRVAAVVAALLAVATAAAAAPRPRSHASSDAAPDVYAGYSWTHAGEASLQGWSLAGSYPYADLRLVAELTGHYGSFGGADLSEYGLLAGVRGMWHRSWPVQPFAETLLGFVRTRGSVGEVGQADTDLSLAFGAGVDYPVNDRWSARGLFQLRLVRGEGSLDTDPRLTFGVAYRFGR